MISDIQFKNYRSFRDVCDFTMEATTSESKYDNVFTTPISENGDEQLLKIAVIYGANASGKTNIIRLLYLLRSMITSQQETQGDSGIVYYDPFLLDDVSGKLPTDISISFIINGVKYEYSLSFNTEEFISEKLSYSPKGVPALIFEREKDGESANGIKKDKVKYGSTIRGKERFFVFRNKLILSKFLFEIPDELITPVAKYLANIHIANGYHNKMIKDLWEEVKVWLEEDNRRKEKLMELLASTDLGIKSFIIPEEEKSLHKVKFTHKKLVKNQFSEDISFHFDDESYGTRQLFVLGGKVLQSLESGMPLFVDEMDTGFHTYISSFILDLYKNKRINKKNAQLIITTHDINLLDENYLRKDQVWFCEKSDEGASELFSLADFEGVREDTPFAEWYMANKFGALPNIKSLEKLFIDETM